MSSLKVNILLNYINTIAGLIFPIITFPYASRVLLPEGIGVVNFQNSIIGYIVLFTSLGIPLYGVREIAKCRNDLELRDRTAVEITILSIVLSLLGYIAVWLLGEYVPRIREELTLFYILSLTIIFSGIGVHWFYQGIEDFLFVTVRGLIFRILFAVSLFIFVKDKDDLLIYGIIIVGSTVGNSVINFVHLRKYLQPSRIQWKKLNVARHIKPAFHIFLLNVIISIYIRLNIIMLGFMVDDRAVGLFTAGMKLTYLIRIFVTSLGAVMLPRCSHLIGENKIEEFNAVITKSYHFLMFMAIPMTFGIILLARPITLCFCGADFMGAVAVVIITAPTIILIGQTNIIGIQILYPFGKVNTVIYSTLFAAIINVVLNILLIPSLKEVGAAISTLATEFSVLLFQLHYGKKYIPFALFEKHIVRYLITSVITAVCISLCFLLENVWWQLAAGSIIGISIYLIILHIGKDPVYKEIVGLFLNRIFFKKEGWS